MRPVARLAVAALALTAFVAFPVLEVRAAPATALARPVGAVAVGATSVEPVCSGCGCRGGAGYRLPSGKCAPRRR